MKVIEIKWTGPFTDEEVKGMTHESDYGIYQVYGNHRIYGENILLYIGQANEQRFGVRIPQHKDWFGWEDAELKYYIGKIGGENNVSYEEWKLQVNLSESILIDYCQPAWNSKGLNGWINELDAIVFNTGIRRCLPDEINKIHWNKTSLAQNNWKAFTPQN